MSERDEREEKLARVVGAMFSCSFLRSALWSLVLFLSIIRAGLQLYPGLWGRVILGMIAAGFLLFVVARRSVAPMRTGPGCCWSMLGGGMRVVYVTGYGLMICGTVLTGMVTLAGL